MAWSAGARAASTCTRSRVGVQTRSSRSALPAAHLSGSTAGCRAHRYMWEFEECGSGRAAAACAGTPPRGPENVASAPGEAMCQGSVGRSRRQALPLTACVGGPFGKGGEFRSAQCPCRRAVPGLGVGRAHEAHQGFSELRPGDIKRRPECFLLRSCRVIRAGLSYCRVRGQLLGQSQYAHQLVGRKQEQGPCDVGNATGSVQGGVSHPARQAGCCSTTARAVP